MDILDTENQLNIYQAESKDITLKIKDKANKSKDLTGHTLIFTVRENLKDVIHLFKKISTDSTQIDITTPRDGTATLHMNAEDTMNLDPGLYIYDIWMIDPAGKNTILLKPSVFEVDLAVTKFS